MSDSQPLHTGQTLPSLEALHLHFAEQTAPAGDGPAPAPTSATPQAVLGPARLRGIAQSARLLGYDRIPVKRSVHHLVWLLTRNLPPAAPATMPQGTLHRVLVIRTAPLAVLERLVSSLHRANPECAITVLCHQKDVDAVNSLGAMTRQPPLVYPRFEPYQPATLAETLAAVPANWDAVFALDNSPTGRGRSIAHIWVPFEGTPGIPLYIFNASGELFCETGGQSIPSIQLAYHLLTWLDHRPPET